MTKAKSETWNTKRQIYTVRAVIPREDFTVQSRRETFNHMVAQHKYLHIYDRMLNIFFPITLYIYNWRIFLSHGQVTELCAESNLYVVTGMKYANHVERHVLPIMSSFTNSQQRSHKNDVTALHFPFLYVLLFEHRGPELPTG
jgi:hypothetical protein